MAILALVIAGVLVLADQLLKLLVVGTIKLDGPVTVIDNLLRFVYVENRGVAFGMLENQRWLFIALTAVAMIVFIVVALRTKIKSKMFFASIALIIGGGIGNLIDRIYLGYVVDYISVSFFPPVCNFADYCITIGMVLLVVYIFFVSDVFKSKDSKELKMTAREHESDGI